MKVKTAVKAADSAISIKARPILVFRTTRQIKV